MNDANGAKQILIHGMLFILVGLLWGLVVPHTPYPRLALDAHIGFEGSGLLYIVLADSSSHAYRIASAANRSG